MPPECVRFVMTELTPRGVPSPARMRSVARVRLHFVRRIQQHPFCRDTDHVVATFEQCFVQCFFGRIRIQVQAGFR